VDAVPDLPLEDGDRFLIPRVPSNVTVQGQVYNANAFVFAPNQGSSTICAARAVRTATPTRSASSCCAPTAP
jgi:hypothetical protein